MYFARLLIAASILLLPYSFAHASFTQAAKNQDWQQAVFKAPNSQLKNYAQWRLLRSGEGEFSASQLQAMAKRYMKWPHSDSMLSAVEKGLYQAGAAQNISHAPRSSYGWVIRAIHANSDSAKKTALTEAFTRCGFDRDDQARITSRFANMLDSAMRSRCVESLLKRDRATQAEMLLPAGSKTPLYKARIAVIRGDNNANAKINALSSALRNDDGLVADRIRYRHRKKLRASAIDLLVRTSPNSEHASRTWKIRNLYARDAIEDKNYGLAKRLLDASGTKLERGDLAEANWLSGWLALTFLNKPNDAFRHFKNLHDNVGFPVSLARGSYWAARAKDASGDKTGANQWYRTAAQYPTTFYGQLAYAKLFPGRPLHLPSPKGSFSANYTNDERFQLSLALMKQNLFYEAAPFIGAMSEEAQEANQLPSLMQAYKSQNKLYARVVTAKYGIRSNNIMAQDGWPRVSPKNVPVELGLLHAISRQESEFNPQAVSHADARGLMQLLPSTARRTASNLGLSYSNAKLFDPAFNMQLGSQFLSDLIERFDGNYILAIAGYNAGPGRSVQWVDRFGRPGKSLEQTLTFIELIPFGETRNYVQRVLENLQVYRALFTPEQPLIIEKDLMR